MTQPTNKFSELSDHLRLLLDTNPAEAVKQAQEIDLGVSNRVNLMNLQAAVLVDGGVLTHQQDAIEQGLARFRDLHDLFPENANITYNVANGLVATIGDVPRDPSWLDYQERTRTQRAEARQYYWKVARDSNADPLLQTLAWTNLANQFTNSYRLSEAHDARLSALKIDPENAVAAGLAARDLLWLFKQGGCTDVTRTEAVMLAKIAKRHKDRLYEYAGAQAAEQIVAFADELGEPVARSPHSDPFISWVERERLTLAPVVELINPALDKLDWLVLPGIRERGSGMSGMPPPVFAMFNMLKSDFILARDLAWRALSESGWPQTGRFADTLDFATYGADTSALVLAHRTALDLLDKVAVTANHYFKLGQPPDKIYFGRLWRGPLDKTSGASPLTKQVKTIICAGARALYGLVELADDYDGKLGILRSQKNLRNAGTHRFVVLHDLGDTTHCRQAPEVEHHRREHFSEEMLHALRVARSAIQMLALAISQHEDGIAQRTAEPVGALTVPDHDWIRGRGKGT